jgi:hypothetical protein
MPKTLPRFFAVVFVNSDEVAYIGRSDWGAAKAMRPGTAHGEGRSIRQAIDAARDLAARARRRLKYPPTKWVNKHRDGNGMRRDDPTFKQIELRSREVREVGFLSDRYGMRPPWPSNRLLE